ncbi:hypothetical protein T06_13382 [Trichinella sp. T6]|nr:hypothetical protein T06_13382 [Trichinella sp. T6]
MAEERLNGLAVHAYIHSDFSIDIHLIFIEVSVTQESGNQKKQLRATFPAEIL